MNSSVSIRRISTSDIDRHFDAVVESKPELCRWSHWCHEQYSRQDTVDWIEARPEAWELNEEWGFVIVDPNDQFLGGCGLHRPDLKNQVAELGYWVRSTATRQGIATGATRQLCRFGFEQLGLERIEIVISVENQASQRVAQKVGAVLEVIIRERILLNGRRHDCALYSILKHEFRRSS